MNARLPFALLVVGCLVLAAPQHVDGQFPKKLKDAAKKAVETRVQQPPAAPAAAPAPAAEPAPAPDDAGAAAPSDPKVWDNYDFVPGNRVLFYTDFSEDKVGNFARRLKYRSGPVEVVERDGVKVLRATGPSELLIPLPAPLPERFTMEIDVISPLPRDGDHDMHEMLTIEGGAFTDRGAQSASIVWMPSLAWIAGGGQYSPASNVTTPEAIRPLLRNHVAHLRLLMDGSYFKMYVNERRLYNIPELAVRRDSLIRVALNAADDQPVYLTSIRVAESETDVLYDALSDAGRWSTQGILFATGKAELQPESRPVLKEIATTMKEHEDLRILIEGHTDNVGNAAANLTLSEARAGAVRDALVTDFGIEEGRITTEGFGDTRPSQPNDTPEGRAQNRRVEIVKV